MVVRQILLILVMLVALRAFGEFMRFLTAMLARLLATGLLLGFAVIVLASIATHGQWT